ncbi:MAG: LCP family protein, partial [bacterium]
NGAKFAAQTLEEVFGLPIHYYGRIDFTGFTNIIDNLGGIKVYVENTINDQYYPILGKEDIFPYKERFERLYIEKGWQKMDGELALKYARSRHTPGIEGSDFARARRQQKIITALKDKAFSFTTLLNPIKLSGLMNAFKEHISTNMEIWEIIKISKTLGNINLEEVASYVFDDSPQNILYSANLDGAYVLQPKTGDFSEMQAIIKNIFTLENVQTVDAFNNQVKVEILNGTAINGLAAQTAEQLKAKGYQVVKTGNAPEQNYEKTVIYDLTDGAKPQAVEALKELLQANVTFTLPAWVNDSWTEFNQDQEPIKENIEKMTTQADILIVLGLDREK